MSYPRRPQMFAMKFCRQLSKSAAAMRIGADGCWLLTVVVMQEDAGRYEVAPEYYDIALADRCGWHRTKVDRVRQKCIEAGYLHYEPGPHRGASKYWVILPSRTLPDDEPTSHGATQNATQSATSTARELLTNCTPNAPEMRTARDTYIPVPVPDPVPINHTPGAGGVKFEVAPGVEVDWLIEESSFMARWNATEGVTHYSRTNIPQELVRSFQDRFLDPGWRERAHKALQKFPLKSGNTMTLGTFLKDGKVDEIIGGSNDWSPGGKRSNTTQRNPSFRHADDAAADWLVADDTGDAAEA